MFQIFAICFFSPEVAESIYIAGFDEVWKHTKDFVTGGIEK